MKSTLKYLLFVILVCMNTMAQRRDELDDVVYDVPFIKDITIDGNANDWGNKGYFINTMADYNGVYLPRDNFDPKFRLAWNNNGLLLLFNVTDDIACEYMDSSQAFRRDCIEIYMADTKGGGNFYFVQISPGMDSLFPKLRYYVDDRRCTMSLPDVKMTVQSRKTGDGYMVEALLPWGNIGIKPDFNREIGLQVEVYDSDLKRQVKGGFAFRSMWFPGKDVRLNTTKMHRVRLSSKPGSPENILVYTGIDDSFTKIEIEIISDDTVNTKFNIVGSTETLYTGMLEFKNGRMTVKVDLDLKFLENTNKIYLKIENMQRHPIYLPNIKKERAIRFMNMDLVYDKYVFNGDTFPACEFDDPDYVKGLIGPYVLKSTFYDSDYNIVEKPKAKGRYGAVTEIHSPSIPLQKRYTTLYYINKPILNDDINIKKLLYKQVRDTSFYYKKASDNEDLNVEDIAKLLCSSAQINIKNCSQDDIDYYTEDRQWWVVLKRKINGYDKKYDKINIIPEKSKKKYGVKLKKGSVSDAGFKRGILEALDSLCRADENASGFNICVAKNGIVLLNKGYGIYRGQRVLPESENQIGCIPKLLSAILMMQLVDKGVIQLDDPISRFINCPNDKITIRHLFTHTSGIDCAIRKWDVDNDYEEVMLNYLTHVKPGQFFHYISANYILVGKILENITGKAYPLLLKEGLLKPLECNEVRIVSASTSGIASAFNVAKFGQLMLNQGVYGDVKVLSKRSHKAMLPKRLSNTLGENTTKTWGIGTFFFDRAVNIKSEGLGDNVYGHGALDLALFRIVPDKRMIIAITRKSADGHSWDQFNSTLYKLLNSYSIN